VIAREDCDGRPRSLSVYVRIANFSLAVVIASYLKAAPAVGAGLALVLAIDVSASVTADSYVLQRNGIARAFENPRLVDAISAVPGGIEVLVLEWSDPDQIKVTVGWQRVADPDRAAAFAAAVRGTKRSSNGLTAIGPALLAAAAAFDSLPEPAGRRIIDISGDGMANFGLPPMAARDRIVAAGISINGLVILTEESWLEGYYRSNVVGGPGAFVVVAQDFGSFADAMLRKLVREVAGTVPAISSPGSGLCPNPNPLSPLAGRRRTAQMQ
jgi:Ca-activated chloride channel homolog